MTRSLLPLLLGASMLCAQDSDPVEEQKDESALSRLPVGATLTEVSLPRFDKQNRRASLLTAETMVVQSTSELEGEDLKIYLFDKQQNISSTASMAKAKYLIDEEMVKATGELLVKSTEDKFLLRGQGGILSLDSRQGLLLGPAETMFVQKKKKPTAMLTPKSIFHLLSGIHLLSAMPPPLVTTEELIDFEKQVAPRITPVSTAKADYASGKENEKGLTSRLTSFLKAAGQAHLLNQVAAPEAKPAVAPAAANKEAVIPFNDLFKAGKERIIIRCEKGIYFDGTGNELVGLGKVSISGKGFEMFCTDGIKVLFAPPEKKASDEKKEDDDPFSNFEGPGEVKQITASGGLIVQGRNKDGAPIEVRGDRALYEADKEHLIIRGNPIGFRQGNVGLMSEQKDAYAVIKLLGGENLSAQTEGQWVIGVPDKFKKKK